MSCPPLPAPPVAVIPWHGELTVLPPLVSPMSCGFLTFLQIRVPGIIGGAGNLGVATEYCLHHPTSGSDKSLASNCPPVNLSWRTQATHLPAQLARAQMRKPWKVQVGWCHFLRANKHLNVDVLCICIYLPIFEGLTVAQALLRFLPPF